jgi:dihydromethanopterin reductase (acceptor)
VRDNFKESIELIRQLEDIEFVSKAASEVLRMYKQTFPVPKSAHIYGNTTASAAPVGRFYYGFYHTLVIAPETLNTVAKCVLGVSDTLTANVFAQARKCRGPIILFACDTASELETEAPKGMVKAFPRRIDLENTERLKTFEATTVVETLAQPEQAIGSRQLEFARNG